MRPVHGFVVLLVVEIAFLLWLATSGDALAIFGAVVFLPVVLWTMNLAYRSSKKEATQQVETRPGQEEAPAGSATKDPASRLATLDGLLRDGSITQEEYQKKRQAIIDEV